MQKSESNMELEKDKKKLEKKQNIWGDLKKRLGEKQKKCSKLRKKNKKNCLFQKIGCIDPIKVVRKLETMS